MSGHAFGYGRDRSDVSVPQEYNETKNSFVFSCVALTGLKVLGDVTVAVRDGLLVCDQLDVRHHHATGRLLRRHRETLSRRERERVSLCSHRTRQQFIVRQDCIQSQ